MIIQTQREDGDGEKNREDSTQKLEAAERFTLDFIAT